MLQFKHFRSPLISPVLVVLVYSCSLRQNPVSKEEALNLAHKIERSMARRDAALLDNLFDEKSLEKRIAEEGGLFLDRSLIRGAVEGFVKSQFGKTVSQSMGKNGSYQLIKEYEKDNAQHILFRLIGESGAVNYHDYLLVKKEEEVKAADVYIYISGENLSKTLAGALQLVAKDMSKADIEKLTSMNNIRELLANGEYEKADSLYNELPAMFKKEKAYQLVHVRICSRLDNDRYIKAMLEYKSLFPNDPNMYLMMVDAYMLQKDYARALESVNKLDSLIDKDPYQDYQRGLLYRIMKDTTHEMASFERLHAKMPDFKKGTVELMETYLAAGQQEKVVRLLSQAKDSNYLNEANFAVIYSYHPELEKEMKADSIQKAGQDKGRTK